MELFLTSSDAGMASYCTKEGQAIYRATRTYPRGEWHGPLVTIEKVLPPNKEDIENGRLQDCFEVLATFQHRFRDNESSLITMLMDGPDTPSIKFKKYFKEMYDPNRKYQLSDQLITGPDGNEYKWKMDGSKCTLFQRDIDRDKPKKQVLNFHRAHRASLFRSEPTEACLEIYEEWLPLLDWIVVTFIIMESRRSPGGA